MYQNTIIIGRLGGDPEMRYTPDGVPVTSFTVAVNRRWTDADGEKREKTTWFRVTTWRRLAEICNEYLAKGRLVMVEGEIRASAYATDDGVPRATLELTARSVKFLDKGNGDKGTEESEGTSDSEGIATELYGDEDDDIPF